MNDHEPWCGLNPANDYYGSTMAGSCVCAEPTNLDVMTELRALGARVDALGSEFARAASQVDAIAEAAVPAIAALSDSPVMRMLAGGGKRGRSTV